MPNEIIIAQIGALTLALHVGLAIVQMFRLAGLGWQARRAWRRATW